MTNPQIVSAIIGVLIAGAIYWLLRRDHLSPKLAFRWLLVAIGVFLIGLFPSSVDWLGAMLGIAYPPIIPILIALGVAIIKILFMDIERTKMQTTQDRIVQKLAILEQKLSDAQQQSPPDSSE